MKRIFVLFAMFTTCLGFSNAVEASDFKVAIVNVTKIVESSAQVNALKKEQQAKMLELESWLIRVRADVESQKSTENKEKLTKKYDAEFVKKQIAMKKDYAEKLNKIDQNITAVIQSEAKLAGYDLVLTKDNVMYGGTDITNIIIKKVK